jgi:hypothetical protein
MRRTSLIWFLGSFIKGQDPSCFSSLSSSHSIHRQIHILSIEKYTFHTTSQSISITTIIMSAPSHMSRPSRTGDSRRTGSSSKRTTKSQDIRVPDDIKKEIIKIIRDDVEAKRAKAKAQGRVYKTPWTICTTDIRRDFDDLTALIIHCELDYLGATESKAFIANLNPAEDRAHYARCAMKTLDMKTQVGVGTNGYLSDTPPKPTMHKVHDYELDSASNIMSIVDQGKAKYPKGFELMYEICTQAEAENRKIIWLVISSVADIAKFAEDNTALFLRVTERIVFQGGYTIQAGIMIPDGITNNSYDMETAKWFFEFLSRKKVRTVAYTRTAANAVKFPGGYFNKLRNTGHILGKTLEKMASRQWKIYYEVACRKDPNMRHKPEQDQIWFLTYNTNWFEVHGMYNEHEEYNLPGPDVDLMKYCRPVLYDALAAVGMLSDNLLMKLGVLKHQSEDPRHSELNRVVGLAALKEKSKEAEQDMKANPQDYENDICIDVVRMSHVIQTLMSRAIERTVGCSKRAMEQRIRSKSGSNSRSHSRSSSASPRRSPTSTTSTRSPKGTDSKRQGTSNGKERERGRSDRRDKRENITSTPARHSTAS